MWEDPANSGPSRNILNSKRYGSGLGAFGRMGGFLRDLLICGRACACAWMYFKIILPSSQKLPRNDIFLQFQPDGCWEDFSTSSQFGRVAPTEPWGGYGTGHSPVGAACRLVRAAGCF